MEVVGLNILLLACFFVFASAKSPKHCSAPPRYPHTSLASRFSNRSTFMCGDKVYYNCDEDFSASRGSRSVQCVGGKWTKLTMKCEKKSCGNAGELTNGEFLYGGNTYIGEKVHAVCKEGYTLKGPNYMICKRSGWAGEFPSCVEGETTCSTPVVANSLKSAGDVSVHRVGDNVTFTCSQGFQLVGDQQITCGPDGKWKPQPPQCLPSPDKTEQSSTKTDTERAQVLPAGECGVPQTDEGSNTHLADKYITMTSFASGDRVQYMCDVGHTQAGGSRYRMCKDGKWTTLFLKCERKLCGSAGEILNGEYIYTGVEFGDSATATCNTGYILVGKATRNCLSHGWDGRDPRCEAVVCEEPQQETNAEMRGVYEPPYTYRSVINYQCRTGTLIGQSSIYCTEDGTWSTPPPQCKEITCPSPNVPDALWAGARNNLYRYRDTISFECKRGYTIVGPRVVTCGPDGRWSPGFPTCRLSDFHYKYRRGH